MVVFSYKPDTDIPDLKDKTIVITGGTNGIGAEAVVQLAKHNAAHIYFTGRNAKAGNDVIVKAKAVAPQTNVSFLQCDFTSLASVQKACEEFLTKSDRLDILILNAGVLHVAAGVSQEGYESHFAINHVSHALMVQSFLPVLQHTRTNISDDVRIVSLTSAAYMLHPMSGIDFKTIKTPQDHWKKIGPLAGVASWQRYGQSKLANLLYSIQLAQNYPDITSIAIHPGVIRTGMTAGLGYRDKAFLRMTSANQILTPEQGSYNLLWAATSPKSKIVSGGFYIPVGVKEAVRRGGADAKLRQSLWDWTQEAIKAFLPEKKISTSSPPSPLQQNEQNQIAQLLHEQQLQLNSAQLVKPAIAQPALGEAVPVLA